MHRKLNMILLMLLVLVGMVFFCASAHAGCRTIVLPDGTVLVVCCDSSGNCIYN